MAATETVLVKFDGPDGNQPTSNLVTDSSGDLFGTTGEGGAGDYGTVFEILKTAAGYASTPVTLVNFNQTDGQGPVTGLVIDSQGDLFGTTLIGGANGDGTVFEVAKTATGYASTPTTLISFNGTDGKDPAAGLTIDANGNLFGTASRGGASHYGTVFELAKTATGYASTVYGGQDYEAILRDGVSDH